MSESFDTESSISIGTSSHFLDPIGSDGGWQGRFRFLTGGTGAPLVMLHTVRTQAEHFRYLRNGSSRSSFSLEVLRHTSRLPASMPTSPT